MGFVEEDSTKPGCPPESKEDRDKAEINSLNPATVNHIVVVGGLIPLEGIS